MKKNFRKVKLLVSILLLTIVSFAQQSNVNVKGQVSDEDGNPIVGATIVVIGTTTGTVSNAEGGFNIDVPIGSTLRFSFIGYNSQELIIVKAEPSLNVIMEAESLGLDEVVVIGYGSAKRKDLTGSVVSIKPKDEEGSTYTSVEKLMQGKAAGVNISSTTSAVGAAVSVTIRGANSLRGDNQPLYVIDNIPFSSTTEGAASAFGSGDLQIAQNPLTSLDPQDIASVEVLKDASATAIYGSRGANGVILITTKKGKKGDAKINFKANFSVAEPFKLHEMLGLDEYVDFRNDLIVDGVGQRYFREGNEIRFTFPEEYEYDPNDPESYRVITERDWQDEIYEPAFSQNYGLTINGGNDKFKYYVSTGLKNINGIVKETGMKLGNLRANLDANLTDRLNVNLILNGSIQSNDMMQGSDVLKGNATGSITRTALDRAPHAIPPEYETETIEGNVTVFNWLEDYDDFTETKAFSGSANILYALSDVFSYNLRIGGNLRYVDRSRWFGLTIFKGKNDNGSLGISEFQANNYTIENLLNYNKSFSSKFRMNGVVGFTYDDYNALNKLYNGIDFDIHSLRTKGLHMANKVTVLAPIQRDYQLVSFLGRTNLVFFDGRYIATLNFRADGSSKFKNDKWGYFPSMALAWNIGNEKFIKDNASFINALKLRGGWGITGSQSIAPYSTINDYTISTIDYANSAGVKIFGASVSRLANESLTWETTESFNAALDFSMFNQRLSGGIEVYQKTTEDLLVAKDIPNSTGFGALLVNQGSLRNRGLEIVLNGTIIEKNDFSWELSGNISFNKGKVLDIDLADGTFGIHENLKAFYGNNLGQSFYVDPANIFVVGREPALFWGHKTDGIIQDKEDIAYIDENGEKQYTTYTILNGGGDPQPGDYKFVDLNNDGVVNNEDQTFIGNPNPDFIYGFQTSVSYKNLTLSATFNGVQGKDVMNVNRRSEFHPGLGTGNVRKEVFQNMWRPETGGNLYPGRFSYSTNHVSDLLVEDASFLRCRDITLSYKLPKRWAKKASFSDVSFFVTGQNLFIITNYSGYDPEVSSFAFDGLRRGIDWNGFPSTRAYTLGFNITF